MENRDRTTDGRYDVVVVGGDPGTRGFPAVTV
jgi:hypothetical protein